MKYLNSKQFKKLSFEKAVSYSQEMTKALVEDFHRNRNHPKKRKEILKKLSEIKKFNQENLDS
jgi:hypothetical protein|tara:strand:+ start:190 stop:378 length:189 start_codon:yes stop_codon:yes gene_type:complete